jgi:hypothetical protein
LLSVAQYLTQRLVGHIHLVDVYALLGGELFHHELAKRKAGLKRRCRAGCKTRQSASGTSKQSYSAGRKAT